MNKKNTMIQRTTEKSKLERDLEGKPRITLKSLKKTAVNTPTQEDYWNLMGIYECGGRKWYSGHLPTQNNYWGAYGEKTCISVKSRFGYSREGDYRRAGCKIISTQEFYDIQKITPDMLREIKNYFETKK